MPSRIASCLVVCLTAAWFFLASRESAALELNQLQAGHFLFVVEGTVARVDSFYDKYTTEQAVAGSTLNLHCTKASKILHEAYYYVAFICNATSGVSEAAHAVYDSVAPSVASDSDSLTMTDTTTGISGNPDCTLKKCKTAADNLATCTYYQCPIDPWCYHTGLACKGAHKCLP
jgi:hypothetical protein